MDTKLFVRKQSGGMFAVIDKGLTTGNIWWVHSGTGTDGAGYGKNPDAPFASIEYAHTQATANNGDRIYVMPGHTETISAAAGRGLDTAGITIEFLGEGNARGSITFGTDAGADMDVDAADITLINPRFVAAIDALTGPIDVNAARFKMINATWQDGTTINTIDCLVADAGADDMVIDGFEFIDGDAAGTQKQSFIQVAGATRPIIKRVRCTGDFATGIIENGTAWIDALLEDLDLDNANASPTVGILLQATSSGKARNCHIRVASGTTYVTANNDMQWFESFGTGTDATAGEKIGTILSGDIEAIVSATQSKTDSVGVQASAVESKAASVGIQASTADSKVGSVGIQASTADSKVGSVGVQASTVESKADSVGVQASAVESKAASVGVQASAADSKVASTGIQVSTTVSKVDSMWLVLSTELSLIRSKQG